MAGTAIVYAIDFASRTIGLFMIITFTGKVTDRRIIVDRNIRIIDILTANRAIVCKAVITCIGTLGSRASIFGIGDITRLTTAAAVTHVIGRVHARRTAGGWFVSRT